MPKSLVVVESPAKAKTINKILGRNYIVKASMGHIRDLPPKELGVDVNNGFTPKYTLIRGKGKTIKELQTAAKNVDSIYLAADLDREGEAICWHLAHELGKRGNQFTGSYTMRLRRVPSTPPSITPEELMKSFLRHSKHVEYLIDWSVIRLARSFGGR